MKVKEIKAKTISELNKLLAQQREILRASRFSVSAKQLKDIRVIRKTKKLIAQILTILKDKKAEAEKVKDQPTNLTEEKK